MNHSLPLNFGAVTLKLKAKLFLERYIKFEKVKLVKEPINPEAEL